MFSFKINPKNEHDPAWTTWVPAYTDNTTPYNIAENSAVGTSIVQIAASDTDTGNQDGVIEYSIVSVTGSGKSFLQSYMHFYLIIHFSKEL